MDKTNEHSLETEFFFIVFFFLIIFYALPKIFRYIKSNIIFTKNNFFKPITEIDMHGLYVGETINKLNYRIEEIMKTNHRSLVVIVGRGLHSRNGPKLKPAVIGYAQNRRIRFFVDSPRLGCITLYI